MRHTNHVLLDNWAVVQDLRNLVRRCADQLHPAFVGLVMGLRSHETPARTNDEY